MAHDSRSRTVRSSDRKHLTRISLAIAACLLLGPPSMAGLQNTSGIPEYELDPVAVIVAPVYDELQRATFATGPGSLYPSPKRCCVWCEK